MRRIDSALPDALTAAADAVLGHVAHGDADAMRAAEAPVHPPVWLWRAAEDWTVEPERPL